MARRKRSSSNLSGGDRHNTAFAVGFVIAGLASSALVLWKSPNSGARTRTLIADRAESTLYRISGIAKAAQQHAIANGKVTGSFSAGARGTGSDPMSDTQPILPIATNGPASLTEPDEPAGLPSTFRGKALTEQPDASSLSSANHESNGPVVR